MIAHKDVVFEVFHNFVVIAVGDVGGIGGARSAAGTSKLPA